MAKDPFRTKFCDLLGVEYPIAAFSHCKDVVAAVTNAGGLGVMGGTRLSPEDIAANIKWIRERVGNKPFGVDVLLPSSVPPVASREELATQISPEYHRFIERLKEKYNIPDPKAGTPPGRWGSGRYRRYYGTMTQEAARRQLAVVLEERVPVFVSGLGSPAFAVQAAHDRGMKVFGLVGKTRQARRLVEAGVDVIVAQGTDSGGHTGPIGTFSLVPQVVDVAGDIPVLAAGGVGTGRHLAAALCLGASGVWTGTIWLPSRESDLDLIIKEKILAASEDDTTLSRTTTGKPVRQLKTQWTAEWEAPGAPPPLPMPLQGVLVRDVLQAIDDYQIAPLMGTPAGQVVGTITKMKPVREIVFDLMDEASEVLEGLTAE